MSGDRTAATSGALAPRARRQLWLSALLLTGILASVLVLASHLRWRLDLTEDGLYSLAPSTVDLLERLDDRLQVKLYFNRDIEGSEHLLPARVRIEDLLREIELVGGDRVSVETVDPTMDLAAAAAAEQAGVQPIPLPVQEVGEVSVRQVYQGLEMRYQDRSEVLPVVVPQQFEFAFASRLAALLQPRRPVVGFFSREPAALPPFPGVEQQVPPGRVYEALRMILGARYAVRDVDLEEADWDEGLSMLLVGQPRDVTESELAALDRYLVGGGRVLLLYDHREHDREKGLGGSIRTGLDDWLAFLGVQVQSPLVWDDRGVTWPLPPKRIRLPDGRIQEIPQPANYGLFPELGGASLHREHVTTATIDRVHLPWAHPVVLKSVPAGLKTETLLESSAASWLLAGDVDVEPYLENIQRLQARAKQSGPPRSYPLAQVLTGRFPSFVPADGAGAAEADEGDAATAPEEGVLVVIGDGDLFAALGLSIRASLVPDSGNQELAENLVDWLASDTALIGLRSRGGRTRPLRNFGREAIEAAGGLNANATREEIATLEREARTTQRSARRWIGWSNVLLPPLVVFGAAMAHFLFWRARARRPYVARGGHAE